MADPIASSEFDAFRFRGEFLASFASIEDLIAPAIERLVALDIAKKSPHLFGQKFELVRKHASERGVWKNPSHVQQILEEIAPFAAMRGTMCHAVIEPATSDVGEEYFLIRPPGKCCWERRTLSIPEAQSEVCRLRDLAQKLSRQVVAAV